MGADEQEGLRLGRIYGVLEKEARTRWAEGEQETRAGWKSRGRNRTDGDDDPDAVEVDRRGDSGDDEGRERTGRYWVRVSRAGGPTEAE